MKANKVGLIRAFVHTSWDIFDHLSYWFTTNLIFCLSAILIIPLPFTLIGLLNSQNKIIREESLTLEGFFKDCRQYGPKAFALALIQVLLILLGILNSYFYHLYFDQLSIFFDLLILLFELTIGAILFFCYPLILVGHSLKNCLKLGFFLGIKYFYKIFIASFFVSLFIFLSSLTVIAIFLFTFATICSFWGNIFDQVRRIEENSAPRPLPEKTFKEVFFPFHP